jgi:hypothetical protein
MRRFFPLILILAGAALATPAAGQPRGPGGPGRGLFVSPAGEPFRRSESTAQPMRAWFAQADADHDGALGWAEFEADFLRWFAVLDADHDGEIAPAEVAHYEQQVLPEMQSRVGSYGGMRMTRNVAARRGPEEASGGGRRGMQQRGNRRGTGLAGTMAMMSGAARFGLLPIAHPVMDADINFNRGVSRQEFSQAAARRFAMLNTQNTGRLTLEQLVEMRRQAFSSGRRDAPGLGEDEEGGEGPPPPGN